MALVVLNEAPMRPAAKMPLIGLPKVRGPKGRSLTLNQSRQVGLLEYLAVLDIESEFAMFWRTLRGADFEGLGGVL